LELAVTISGKTYAAAACMVYLDGKSIGASGTFTPSGSDTIFSYTLPYTTAAGNHTLKLVTNDGYIGSLSFTVTAPKPSVTVNAAAQVISLSGFAPGEEIDLRINASVITGITADNNGGYVYIPSPLYTAGTYNITARGKTSSLYATAKLTVEDTAVPSVSADKSEARPGQTVTLTFNDFNRERDNTRISQRKTGDLNGRQYPDNTRFPRLGHGGYKGRRPDIGKNRRNKPCCKHS
jgi:hypothetical protein